MKYSAVAAAISSIVLLSACGSAEGSSLLDVGSSSAPKDDIMSSAPAATGDTSGGTTTGTDPFATTPSSGGSSTPAPGGGAGGKQPPTGMSFVDPEGKYSMTIDPGWKIATNLAKGAEGWIIGPTEGTVPTTVAVLTEDFTGAAVGITLKQYMTISVRNMKNLGFTVVKSTTVGGFNSPTLGVLEYEGSPNGAANRRFLAIVDVNRTGASVATLISGPKTFTRNRGAGLPYMLTIKAN